MNNSIKKIRREESDPCFFKVDTSDDYYNVSYEITNKCNLECQHCFNKSDKNSYSGLSKEKIILLIKELAANNIKNVYITGGEPTCYPFFKEALQCFYENNIEIILATNGYNSIEFLDVIKKYSSPKAGVHISLDGIEKTHNEFRGKEDAYERVINSIKTFIKNEIPVKISTVVWNKNYEEIEYLVDTLKKLGVSQINLNILVKSGRTDIEKIKVNKDYYTIISKISNIKNKFEDKNFKVIIKRGKALTENSCDCYAGLKIMHINSEGIISPCSWIAKADIKEYSMKWQPGNLKDCINKIKKVQEIVKFRKNKYGYAGCMAMAKIYNNDSKAEDPLNNLIVAHNNQINKGELNIQEDVWNWNKMKNNYWNTPTECSYYYLNEWKQRKFNSVLDIGAGIGRHSILFAKNNFSVTAFDISTSGLSYIKEMSEKNNLKIDTVQGDMTELPFEDCQFDCIFAYHSIYHASQNSLQLIVDELYRVLKDNGEALVTMLSKEDSNFQENKDKTISKNTILKRDGKDGPLVPHYYIEYDEIFEIFNKFNIINIKKVIEFYNGKKLCHYFLHLKK